MGLKDEIKVRELELVLRSYLCDVLIERKMMGVLVEYIRVGVDGDFKKKREIIYGKMVEVLDDDEVERIINELSSEELNDIVQRIMEVNKIPFMLKLRSGGRN